MRRGGGGGGGGGGCREGAACGQSGRGARGRARINTAAADGEGGAESAHRVRRKRERSEKKILGRVERARGCFSLSFSQTKSPSLLRAHSFFSASLHARPVFARRFPRARAHARTVGLASLPAPAPPLLPPPSLSSSSSSSSASAASSSSSSDPLVVTVGMVATYRVLVTASEIFVCKDGGSACSGSEGMARAAVFVRTERERRTRTRT